MRKHIIIPLTIVTFLITGCGKSKNDPVVAGAPDKATLTFPAQNSACTTGTVVSEKESTITFTWNSSANTDSYELDITNLLTGTVTSQLITTNKLPVNLLRNTPYSWFVISKSNSAATKAQSDTWKFYNAGAGTTSHPPFPADNLTPAFAQSVNAPSGVIDLTWTATDPDGDIAGYDVYLGLTPTPTAIRGTVTDNFMKSVIVTSGRTYYWKVITKDTQGNTSDSGLFQFKVN